MTALTSFVLPPLIGITGRKGAGKDTVADHLVEVFGYRRYSFADPIKQALIAVFDAPQALFNDPAQKEIPSALLMGRTPRYLMQTLGTEWGRDLVDPVIWVELALRRVEAERLRGHMFTVVPDVRFDDEARALKQAGGLIWEVVRTTSPYAGGDAHRSEAGIDARLIDTQIKNTADTRMLFTQVGVAIKNAVSHIQRPDNDSSIKPLPPLRPDGGQLDLFAGSP